MNLGRLWTRFWSLAGSVSVRIKIMGIVLVLILIFGLGITFQVRNSLTTTLTGELEKQGIEIAQHLAVHSTDLVLTANSYDLLQQVSDTVENNEAVRYALVLSPEGNVISHSFGTSIPVGLLRANWVEASSRFRLERLDTNEGLILDIAVPVFGGRVGVARVGMSTNLLYETIAATTRRWLIITGVVSLIGLVASYSLTSVLTRPIKHLVEATKAISKGDLNRKAPVWAQDEIGRLAISFNAMTESLAKAHGESETFQSELVRRNLELAALNTISTELSRSRELGGMMRRSLTKVIESMSLDAGWVSTLIEDGKQATAICHQGLSQEAAEKIAIVNVSNCACKTAIDKKMPVVVSNAETPCPILNEKLDNGQRLLSHAAVPLISKGKVFGLLHVASSETNLFTAEQINLLGAIGHQMGVAIENARLWEELKRKEEMRGHLLEETISAQEAERKRIARELHDQTGQLLTSLMVGLKALEMSNPKETRHKIANLRQLTAQTLDEVHNLALELRPSSLDDLGLISALEQYTREYSSKFGVSADFQAIGFDSRRLPPETEITLYRIVQEALTNVAKHAEATKVSVLLEARGPSIVAIVEDDGKGFDVHKKSTAKERLGLYGMYERAELIDARLTIESRPGKGTTVFVEVPLKERETEL